MLKYTYPEIVGESEPVGHCGPQKYENRRLGQGSSTTPVFLLFYHSSKYGTSSAETACVTIYCDLVCMEKT